MNTASVQMFQPIQKQSFMKENAKTDSENFDQLMKRSFMSQMPLLTESKNEHDINRVKQFLNNDAIVNNDLQQLLKTISELLNSEKDNHLLEHTFSADEALQGDLLDLFNQGFDVNQLTVLFERMLGEDEMMLVDANDALSQLLTQLELTVEATEENDNHIKVEEIITDESIEVDDLSELQIVQLLTQLQSVMEVMKQGASPNKVARILLPLLNEWASMSKQYSNTTLNELATNFLDAEDLEMLKHVQDLYDKRTHFQSKQMYGENATVTRSDIVQWIKAAFNQSQDQEQTHRVIPTLNNETITAPRISAINQQAVHNFSQLESVQRIEAEMTTRITNMIQQHMSLQQRGPMQSLSMVLTPEHLGTLQVNFSQVNGEMIVRIIASSGYAKEMLESNLHQLKHAFSPHQVQVIRGDDTVIEDDIAQQKEEQSDEHQEHEEEQPDEQYEEQIMIDFTTLFTDILEKEVLPDDKNR